MCAFQFKYVPASSCWQDKIKRVCLHWRRYLPTFSAAKTFTSLSPLAKFSMTSHAINCCDAQSTFLSKDRICSFVFFFFLFLDSFSGSIKICSFSAYFFRLAQLLFNRFILLLALFCFLRRSGWSVWISVIISFGFFSAII